VLEVRGTLPVLENRSFLNDELDVFRVLIEEGQIRPQGPRDPLEWIVGAFRRIVNRPLHVAHSPIDACEKKFLLAGEVEVQCPLGNASSAARRSISQPLYPSSANSRAAVSTIAWRRCDRRSDSFGSIVEGLSFVIVDATTCSGLIPVRPPTHAILHGTGGNIKRTSEIGNAKKIH